MSQIEKLLPKINPSTEKAQLQLPNGKTIDLPILKPELGPPQIDVRALFGLSNFFTFDPGYANTGMCASTITYIDGEKGEILHRGYSIFDLAGNVTYIEYCYLMIYGELPSEQELEKFEGLVVSEMMLHEKFTSFYQGFKKDAHPMAIMLGVVGALSSFMHDFIDIKKKQDRETCAIKLIAKMPTLTALAFRTANGLPKVYPKKEFSFMKNFLYMLFQNPMLENQFQLDSDIEKAMDTLLILYADHEQSSSTATVRIAGSSLANPFACIASGISSLWGPAHGGASEAVLDQLLQIKKEQDIDEMIEKAKNKISPFRLMGFGHRVYKCYDPRALIVKNILIEYFKNHPNSEGKKLFESALKLEEKALKDEYFIKKKLFTNLDFFAGVLMYALGIPKNMFVAIFAQARSVGWITQWSEMMAEDLQKISRPRQLYVGESYLEYIPIEKRKEDQATNVQEFDKLVKLTKLTKLSSD